jgi:hypothetical protein
VRCETPWKESAGNTSSRPSPRPSPKGEGVSAPT